MRRALPLLVGLLLCSSALGQEACRLGDFGCGHEEWHRWYQTGENGGPLMRPHMPGVMCCGRDCRPTNARFVDGRWQVWLDGGWTVVPADRIKTNVTTPNGMAHACATQRWGTNEPVVHCFVPPEAGS